MSDGYNGYANYPTWATALWMDNEPASNEFLYALANREPVYDQSVAELFDKANNLEEYVKETLLDNQLILDVGLGTDLIGHAIGVINWREIIETHTEVKV